MTSVESRLERLSREQVLEAAHFVAREIVRATPEDAKARAALAELIEHPYQHLPEFEELARLVLVSAASIPEHKELVERSLEGAGKKQVVLAGAEIVALSIVGVMALQVIISGGKSGDTTTTVVEQTKDGKTTIKTTRTVKYGLVTSLGSVLAKYFG